MSEYMVCETEMKDLEVVMETLAELGFPAGKVSVHNRPVALEGYSGDQRAQKAHVVIKRVHVGRSSNDIGFEKQANGSYKAWVSAYDQRRGLGGEIMNGRMKRLYDKNMVVRTAKRQGYRIVSCEEEDGKIRMRVLPR